MKERYLYRNMKDECTGLLKQDPPFASFYNAVENPGPVTAKHIKAFYLADRNTELALTPSANDAVSMDSYQTQTESLSASLEEVLEQIAAQGELPNLVQQRNALLLGLHNLSLNVSTLTNSITAGQAQGVATVAADNSAISTAVQVEINEKTVNNIYFSTLALGNNDFSSTQLTQLQGLANQCPYEGGTAVFRARNLLATLDADPVEYDDEALCQPQQSGGGGSPLSLSPNAAIGAVVFPNPASDLFTVLLERPLEIEGNLVLHNAYEQAVLSQILDVKTVNFDFNVEGLAGGIYVLNIREGKNVVYTTRLVLIK